MKESQFQKSVIDEIKERFPDCIIMKNDASYIQGIPDLLILNNDKWAALECKRNKNASRRPNQNYYVDKMQKMSYANFIYPENKKEVIDELQRAFEI